MNKAFYALFFIVVCPVLLVAQKNYKTPEYSWGLELNWSASNLMDLKGTNSNVFNPKMRTGFGGSIVVPFQYAPKKSFFGFQSGLGFFMWGTTYRNWHIKIEKESLYSIGIPMAVQFKVSKSFWLESGFQANFAVYNTLRHAGISGKLPLVELQYLLGFRYHIFKSLAIKARLHVGLTPAYQIIMINPPYSQEDIHNQYRFGVFELGMSYLFPLKK